MVPNTTRRTPAARALSALAAVVALGGCGVSGAEIRAAQTSGYVADFAVVYSEALAATRELYPQLAEDARTGIIRTAWHPVRLPSNNQDGTSTTGTRAGATNPAGGGALTTTGAAGSTYFARFTVFVVGGRPWRVRVEGEASLWKVGEVPTPLRGADLPPWLGARMDSLRVAIYRRLKKHAVPLAVTSSRAAPRAAKVDVSRWSALPPAAASVVAAVERAATARDTAVLRRHMVDDFRWSLGSEPSADVALATWQADPTLLDALVAVLGGACALEEGKAVVCAAPLGVDVQGHRAFFELRGPTWKLTAFVAGD